MHNRATHLRVGVRGAEAAWGACLAGTCSLGTRRALLGHRDVTRVTDFTGATSGSSVKSSRVASPGPPPPAGLHTGRRGLRPRRGGASSAFGRQGSTQSPGGGQGATVTCLPPAPRALYGHVPHHLHGLLPAGRRPGRLPHVLLRDSSDGEWVPGAQGCGLPASVSPASHCSARSASGCPPAAGLCPAPCSRQPPKGLRPSAPEGGGEAGTQGRRPSASMRGPAVPRASSWALLGGRTGRQRARWPRAAPQALGASVALTIE